MSEITAERPAHFAKRWATLKRTIYFLFPAIFLLSHALAQVPVLIADDASNHIFTFNQLDILEDPSGNLNIGQILTKTYQEKFVPNSNRIPKNVNTKSVYWYRFRIGHNASSSKRWILEFFDQSIADLQLFVPDGFNSYEVNNFGTNYGFGKRVYEHKNFTYDLNNKSDKLLTYYIRLKSPNPVSAIVVLRDLRWFLGYALSEYFIFGLFYGMILVFCLYNLLMYFAIKGKQYLFYVLYNLSIGLYEMCNDGIAFQYLWPSYPQLNSYGFGIALFLSSIFGILFTVNFLYLKFKAPKFYKAMLLMVVLRSIFFIACFFDTTLFDLKVIEFFPLLLVFAAAIYVYRKGYKPAGFLVLGYGFLVAGFTIKILLQLQWIPYGVLNYYSLSMCFLVEMVVVSFAIGNSIRSLRKKKNRAQKRIIQQLQINEQLNQQLNAELTELVEQRTVEIRAKAAIIEKQNLDISIMNSMLKKDNKELNLNIERVTKARMTSKIVDFEEFSRVYPDKEHCLKYLSDLKWNKGYACKKCTNTHYLSGQTLYGRRCTKCGYDESVIANTVFQNSRIPINKALYMLFLVYNSKGTISSYKLSQILTIRQSTCWTYNSKMQKLYHERKDELLKAGEEGWSKMALGNPF
ncbi:7TM diverse intracellular signaling domain-containing protein [Pedobacter duraquae]|uniref:7TMR-DISM extracellular protein 2 n=1 Tax=Pedobacter duraquae TaxID=425511 RepID=A0A4R6IQ68_9SPHI|nr:7TM diverse intracellular signaling domain-containing protein [Pedobacter duraquae]TDO24484.1 7TMR-DISM extracellular protein 2 [Pedobacter duraquae]